MVNAPVVHKPDGPDSEAVLPIPRQTISYYLISALVVIPFRAVTPASWCYVLYSLYTGSIWSYTPKQLSLFVVAIAEVGALLNEYVTSDDESRWRAHTGLLQCVPLSSGEISFWTISHPTRKCRGFTSGFSPRITVRLGRITGGWPLPRRNVGF